MATLRAHKGSKKIRVRAGAMRAPGTQKFVAGQVASILEEAASFRQTSVQRCIARGQLAITLREELQRQAARLAKYLELSTGGRGVDHQVENSARAVFVQRAKDHSLKAEAVATSASTNCSDFSGPRNTCAMSTK